jgi:hypothetical protein
MDSRPVACVPALGTADDKRGLAAWNIHLELTSER